MRKSSGTLLISMRFISLCIPLCLLLQGGEPLPLLMALYVNNPGLSIAINSQSSLPLPLPLLHSQAVCPPQPLHLLQMVVQPPEFLMFLHQSPLLEQASVCPAWVSAGCHMSQRPRPLAPASRSEIPGRLVVSGE